MKKVLYFDVEYANAKNKSICQLGLLSEYYPSGDPVFPEKNIFINPEDGFQDWCIKVHGITEKQVETEPKILEDNVITVDEVNELQSIVREYYETIMGSPITNSLQELRGILKGIIVDNKISTEEGENLIKWLYNNIHLSEYYPYNHISSLFATVLEDGIITEKESNSLIEIINSILSPLDSLKEQISCVQNKHVCLSGNFSHG